MKYLSILILFFTAACSNGKNATKNSVSELTDATSIYLERGSCYGTCPIYKVTIYPSGKVSYSGKAYVDNVGEFEGQMNKEVAQALIQKVTNYDWKSYPDMFPVVNVDFPSFTLVYTDGDYTKKVKGNSRAAEELVALTKEIDLLLKDVSLK